MFAALPMYEYPWVRLANDQLWTGLRAALRDEGIQAPEHLTRGVDLMTLWGDPRLLFAQACGYPLMTSLRGRVRVIAAPTYGFEGCGLGEHCSFLMARRTDARASIPDFRTARAAVNARDSNTGMNLFRAAVAPWAAGPRFFSQVAETGSHYASLEAVAMDQADLAAVDCVSFGLISQGAPDLAAKMRIIARSANSPTLPFVSSAGLGAKVHAALRRGLGRIVQDPDLAAARAQLGWRGIIDREESGYAVIMRIAEESARFGYRELA